MRKLISLFTVFFLFVLFLIPVRAQWELKTNGLPGSWKMGLAIDACDTNTAVISIRNTYPTPNAIYITKNGGDSWEELTWPFASLWEEAEDISIIDSSNIFFCTDEGRIFSTENGGESWTLQFFDTTKTTFMNYIEMFDLDNGIAMGDGLAGDSAAVILKTENSGDNWISTNDSAFGQYLAGWRKIDFINSDEGFFYPHYAIPTPQKLWKTMDSGNSWDTTNFSGDLDIIKFYDGNIGLAIDGYAQKTYRTLDGGSTWEDFYDSSLSAGLDIEFIPGNVSNVWRADSRTKLYFSNDTGRTWILDISIEGTAEYNTISDIVFTDELHGWFLCDTWLLYRTTTGGSGNVGIKNEKVNQPVKFKLEHNYPNPFNAKTTIRFTLSKPGYATLNIYNTIGKKVVTLANKTFSAGVNKIEWDAEQFASGIYFYRLQVGKRVETKKCILLK